MKKRIPKISNSKLRGEWAEMCFIVRAMEHGLQLNKPWGEMRGYDFVVGRPGHFVSVQVKSTIAELEEGDLCMVRSGPEPYPPGSFDFLAAYVVFEDAWYIIPEETVRGMNFISLHTKSKQARYEKYREAWHLLQPDPETEGKRVDDIHACVGEAWNYEGGMSRKEEMGLIQ